MPHVRQHGSTFHSDLRFEKFPLLQLKSARHFFSAADDKRSQKADLAEWKCEMKEEHVNETGREINSIKRRIFGGGTSGSSVFGGGLPRLYVMIPGKLDSKDRKHTYTLTLNFVDKIKF